MTTINPTIIDSNLNPNQQQVVQQPAQPQQRVQQPIQPAPPQTYIVQAGDNLSTIAQRYGVNVANITGYRSDNPNIIYPGEQLTINKPIQQQPVQQQGQQPTQQPVQQQQPEPDVDDEFAGYRQAEQNLQGLLNQYNARFTSDDFFSNPQKTVQDLISQVMTTMNVPSITESMSNLSKEIESLTNEMNDEIAKINNNPWLIESQRVQQIRNAQDKYENKINAKVSRLSLEEGMLQNARQQAQYITTTALNMYDKERSFQMEGLENMIKRAENELNFQAKLIEDARKPNEEKLDVFTDASGDRIVTFYNKKTGETRQVSLGTASEISSKQQVIGSAESGYQIVTYDKDGNVTSLQQITGGGNNSGFTKDQNKLLSNYLGEVASYTDRETALSELNKYQSKIVVDVGENGFNVIREEIDRIFPAVQQAGGEGSLLKGSSSVTPSTAVNIVKTLTSSPPSLISSFFSRLFLK